MAGRAICSVVPGATVVSMRTRQSGLIRWAMMSNDSSRAPISTWPRAHVAQVVLRVVELDIDNDNVREFEDIVHIGGDKGLLLKDAPSYHRLDLGVLRLHG